MATSAPSTTTASSCHRTEQHRCCTLHMLYSTQPMYARGGHSSSRGANDSVLPRSDFHRNQVTNSELCRCRQTHPLTRQAQAKQRWHRTHSQIPSRTLRRRCRPFSLPSCTSWTCCPQTSAIVYWHGVGNRTSKVPNYPRGVKPSELPVSLSLFRADETRRVVIVVVVVKS